MVKSGFLSKLAFWFWSSEISVLTCGWQGVETVWYTFGGQTETKNCDNPLAIKMSLLLYLVGPVGAWGDWSCLNASLLLEKLVWQELTLGNCGNVWLSSSFYLVFPMHTHAHPLACAQIPPTLPVFFQQLAPFTYTYTLPSKCQELFLLKIITAKLWMVPCLPRSHISSSISTHLKQDLSFLVTYPFSKELWKEWRFVDFVLKLILVPYFQP